MGGLIKTLMSFLSPVVVFCSSLVSIVAFLLGALKNPQGWMNFVICSAIDYIAEFFPETPPGLRPGSLISSVASQMPAVGRGVVSDVFEAVAAIAALAIIIKIYKLLPFKMS